MSELDKVNKNISTLIGSDVVATGNTTLNNNDTPQVTGVIAEATRIHPEVEGDRICYRDTMEKFRIAIEGGAPMNPDHIIDAARDRGELVGTQEVDASLLGSKTGIKDYPDGSFLATFEGEKRLIISGQLQSPQPNQNELQPGSTQLVLTPNSLSTTDNPPIQTVPVIQGIMVSNSEPTQLQQPNQNDHDAQLPNNPFLLKKAA